MKKLIAAGVAIGAVAMTTPLGAGIAAAETALIVSGSATPTGPAAKLYHFKPNMVPLIGAKYYNSAEATKQQVAYPGTIWPLTGVNSPTLGQSVATGTNNLDAAIRSTDGPMVVPGLSQGTLVLDAEQRRLATDPTAPAPDQLTFIKVSDASPLFQKIARPGTTLPVLGYTVPQPVESQYDTINIVSQYDIYSDPLDRPTNLLALANAVVGREHTLAAFTDPASVPPQFVSSTVNSRGATETTYFLTAPELPLVTQLRQIGVPNNVADQLNVVFTPMVARAYGPAPAPIAPAGQNLPTLQQIANIPENIQTLTHTLPAVTAPVSATTSAANIANTARVVSNVQKWLPGKKGKR